MDPNVPIAIVGMSCRFAGDVSDPQKLWELVAEGRSAWSEIPSSRFNLDGVYHPNFAKLSTVCPIMSSHPEHWITRCSRL